MKKLVLVIVIIMVLAVGAMVFKNTEKEENVVGDIATKPEIQTNAPLVGAKKVVLTDTGRYQGLADNNFFEVKISGVPDEKAARVFMITDLVREEFEKLDLKKDEVVKIEYIENEYGQLEVQNIEKIKSDVNVE